VTRHKQKAAAGRLIVVLWNIPTVGLLANSPRPNDAHNRGGTGVLAHGRVHSSVATIHHRVRQPAGGGLRRPALDMQPCGCISLGSHTAAYLPEA
jgi:hypothetical protein